MIRLREEQRDLNRLLRSAWDTPAADHYDRYEALARTNREAREKIKRMTDKRRGKGKPA